MKMSLTLKWMCLHPTPFASLLLIKRKLVQRLQEKLKNSKQLSGKQNKTINRIEPLTSELSWQTSHPMHSRCALQRGGGETGTPVCGASRSTGKPSPPPLTLRALEKAGKNKAPVFACTLAVHTTTALTGSTLNWHPATGCCSSWRLHPYAGN